MMPRSDGGNSRNAQGGNTIIGFQRPTAAGTRTRPEVARVTGRETNDWVEFNSARRSRTDSSRLAGSTALQVWRNSRRRQSPTARRAVITHTARIQIIKKSIAQGAGILIAVAT